MLRAFESNPLRAHRQAWVRGCGGLPGFEFIAYVLEHGLVVTDPEQRPAPFNVPNHGSFDDRWKGPKGLSCRRRWYYHYYYYYYYYHGVFPPCPAGSCGRGADRVPSGQRRVD